MWDILRFCLYVFNITLYLLLEFDWSVIYRVIVFVGFFFLNVKDFVLVVSLVREYFYEEKKNIVMFRGFYVKMWLVFIFIVNNNLKSYILYKGREDNDYEFIKFLCFLLVGFFGYC